LVFSISTFKSLAAILYSLRSFKWRWLVAQSCPAQGKSLLDSGIANRGDSIAASPILVEG
ncbi:hypothetical protein, partial [Tunturiibacter psychrotolerans]|uniref:hypothetical protein n=1 Tax=Tunturiibacter psychrotolerans TaxID=3069686 RepID=UPI003D1AC09A